MAQKNDELINPTLRKTDIICCGILEKMQLGWMKFENGTKCMPHIHGHSDDNLYRVNNCPSCGKYVGDVMIEKFGIEIFGKNFGDVVNKKKAKSLD